jgi:hypothetical protein
MKLDILFAMLSVVVGVYNVFTLPPQATVLSFLAALALYGLTESTLAVFIVFIATPFVLIATIKEGFQGNSAVEISERVKKMKAQKEVPQDVSGNTEGFTDPSGSSVQIEDQGMPTVSVPAYVKQQGRLLVVPEHSMPRMTASVDSNPIPNPVMQKADPHSVGTALATDATMLPEPDVVAGNMPSM